MDFKPNSPQALNIIDKYNYDCEKLDQQHMMIVPQDATGMQSRDNSVLEQLKRKPDTNVYD